MSIALVTAIADPGREAQLASELGDPELGVTVVRRCVDIAELLAAASAGLAQAAVVSADLRRLDRVAVRRLAEAGVAVVGMAIDQGDREHLCALGVMRQVSDLSPAQDIAAAAIAAVCDGECRRDSGEPAGRVVAVWGPAGAPGRSTIALNLAAELAGLGHGVLCADIDTYGASLGQLAGLLDEGSGLAAACRRANGGDLGPADLRSLAVRVRPGLDLLTGITSARRWPELRPAAIDAVLDVARSSYGFTVLDIGGCIEEDEELAYDTVAPRRNGAAITALEAADKVVAVASADPIGLARLAASIDELPRGVRPITVVNRVRRIVVGHGDPSRAIATALERHARITDAVMVPESSAIADAAVAAGRTWAEVSARSPARLAVRDLARRIAGTARPARGTRRSLVRVGAQLLARH